VIVVDQDWSGAARRFLANTVAGIWAGGSPADEWFAWWLDDRNPDIVEAREGFAQVAGIDAGDVRRRLVMAEALAPAERDEQLLLILKEIEHG
jgi:hypothetical protein